VLNKESKIGKPETLHQPERHIPIEVPSIKKPVLHPPGYHSCADRGPHGGVTRYTLRFIIII